MTVFFDVADQSYLPTILERDELVDGNAKLQISQSAATILGQPMGGGIVGVADGADGRAHRRHQLSRIGCPDRLDPRGGA